MIALMGAVLAQDAPEGGPRGRVEFEIRQAFRRQRVSAVVSPGIVGFQDTVGVMAEAHLRLTTEDGRLGLEVFGAGDGLTFAAGFRPERWGGFRGLVAFRGHPPLVDTLGILRAGLVTVDVRRLTELAHTPTTTGQLGLEIRRYTVDRLERVEGDLFVGPGVVGAQARTLLGFAIGDTGWYATFGASTQRIWDVPPAPERDLVQVSHGIETSMVYAPPPPRPKRR